MPHIDPEPERRQPASPCDQLPHIATQWHDGTRIEQELDAEADADARLEARRHTR